MYVNNNIEESSNSKSHNSLSINGGGEVRKSFYIVENATDEDILHEYHQCNVCNAEPIWGLRFKCTTCEDVDLCEGCFDARLKMINLRDDEKDSKIEEDDKMEED